ncbi:MAG: IS66 family insertion sequence element accessory protein TnpB [Proteobacteria bacterium]|nr:IS66 family insertion sequence element accessory protein TnpB [Pseudomonadota bacterium]
MPGLTPRPKATWLAVAPVDMRLGAEGLSLHVQQALRASLSDGSAFLFRNKRGNRIKNTLMKWLELDKQELGRIDGTRRQFRFSA